MVLSDRQMQDSPLFNVVLVEPEIPNNTGNIGRLCVGTRCRLHLVEPLGFQIDAKQLRRAGLDYWPHLDWCRHKNWQAFQESLAPSARLIFFTTKTEESYFDFEFQEGDYLVFGKETKGLDPQLWQGEQGYARTIPMLGPIRSHNLANSVTAVVYEALRQNPGIWR